MPDLIAARDALIDLSHAVGLKVIDPTREGIERRMRAVLERVLKGQYDAILAKLGEPPDLSKLDMGFWKQLDSEAQKEIQNELEQIYLDAALAQMNESPIGVDWGVVNQSAASFARSYTYELVERINKTSRAALQQKVGGFFEHPLTISGLRDSLKPLFGEVRAQTIAVTEVTRASVQGQRDIVQGIERQGVRMRPAWLTNNDELVCPICMPLDGLSPGEDGQYHHPTNGETYDAPPAHPNCRCNERFTMVGPND